MFRTFTVDGGVNGNPNLLKNYMQINMANAGELMRMVVNDCAKEHDFDANYTYNKLYNNGLNEMDDLQNHIENSQNVCTKRGRPTKERRVTETGSPNNLFDGLMNDNLYNNTNPVLDELEEDIIDTIDEEDEEEDTTIEVTKELRTCDFVKIAEELVEEKDKVIEEEKKETDKESKKLEKEKKETDKEAKKLEKEKKEADKEAKKLEKEKKEAGKEAKKLEKEKKEADKEAKKLKMKEKKEAKDKITNMTKEEKKEAKKLEKEKKEADKEDDDEEIESVKVHRIFENGTTVPKEYEGNEKIYYKSKTTNDIYSEDCEKIGVLNGTNICFIPDESLHN
jgi:chromosome segregation ATPase